MLFHCVCLYASICGVLLASILELREEREIDSLKADHEHDSYFLYDSIVCTQVENGITFRGLERVVLE